LSDGLRFRWVECQLNILRQCYKKRDLLRALDSLPQDLESTYERILLQIPREYADDASVVFMVMSCASRPILLEEAADIIAVDLASGSFDPQDRPNDPSSILAICSTLLSAVEPRSDVLGEIRRVAKAYSHLPYLHQDEFEISELYRRSRHELSVFPCRPRERELSFSHLSVKEYLESDGAPPSFRITPEDANATMARLCLVFLVSAELSLPFITYASKYWLQHAQKSDQQKYFDLESLVQQLFDDANVGRLWSWMEFGAPLPEHLIPRRMIRSEVTIEGRLFYASFLGFLSICQKFIADGANVNAVVQKVCVGALTGACLGGHKAIVELLLDHGADPNPPIVDRYLHLIGSPSPNANKFHWTPLSAACFRGDVEIMRLLLAKTVDIDFITLRYVLFTAAAFGAVEVVQLLLDRGAEVNFRVRPFWWFRSRRHPLVIDDKGDSPLCAAICGGHEQVLLLLLKHGAEVGDCLKSALTTEALENPRAKSMIAQLLAHVSMADVKSGMYDVAFQQACSWCPDSIIRLFEAAGFGDRVDRLMPWENSRELINHYFDDRSRLKLALHHHLTQST
jgi:ankyrin repeat domain-containing protein 50